MVDNEIIKALECCNRNGSCSKCPYDRASFEHEPDCASVMTADALNLINRQKAEIKKQEAEIERLNKILDYYALEYGSVLDKSKVISKAKAEGAKELAERAKAKMADKKYKYVTETNYSKTVNAVIDACIDATDNLVKEFTEEQGGVTAESAISALQEAAKKFKDAPLDAYLGLQIGRTMDMGDNQE